MIALNFLRYAEIESLNSKQRVKKLVGMVKDEKIILLEGRVTPQEEAELIAAVMTEITPSSKFKGVELAVVDPDLHEGSFFMRLRKSIAAMLLGSRTGFTIIGPASVIKEIKRDPSKIEFYTNQKG